MSILVDANTVVPMQGFIAGGCAIATARPNEMRAAAMHLAHGPGAFGSVTAEVPGS